MASAVSLTKPSITWEIGLWARVRGITLITGIEAGRCTNYGQHHCLGRAANYVSWGSELGSKLVLMVLYSNCKGDAGGFFKLPLTWLPALLNYHLELWTKISNFSFVLLFFRVCFHSNKKETKTNTIVFFYISARIVYSYRDRLIRGWAFEHCFQTLYFCLAINLRDHSILVQQIGVIYFYMEIFNLLLWKFV